MTHGGYANNTPQYTNEDKTSPILCVQANVVLIGHATWKKWRIT